MWNQGSIQKDDGSKNKMFGRWGGLFLEVAFEFLNGLTFCKN